MAPLQKVKLNVKPVKMEFIKNSKWEKMEANINKNFTDLSNYIRRK